MSPLLGQVATKCGNRGRIQAVSYSEYLGRHCILVQLDDGRLETWAEETATVEASKPVVMPKAGPGVPR